MILTASGLAHRISQAEDIQTIVANCDERIEKHRKSNVTLRLLRTDGSPLQAGTEVDVELVRHAFLFGCNLSGFGEYSGEDESLYRERFSAVMNCATLSFYWHTYEPRQGRRLSQPRMEAARWCRSRNIVTKGHPLVWNMEPDWVAVVGRVRAEQMLWSRISDEVERFAGVIDIWDVVNEPTHGIKYARQRRATALLNAYEKYGVVPVVTRAFELARASNPKATLVLNDFDTSAAYERVIRSVLDAGSDVNAIGIQSHMHAGYWGAAELWKVCNRFGRFGIPLHFTELTVISGKHMSDQDWESVRDDWNSTPDGEQRQAEYVREIYHLLFSHPQVSSITWWDLSDRGAWMGAPGGLLRRDLSAKPAYYVVRNLIREGWSTHVRGQVSPTGQFSLRGFHGRYSVRTTQQGKVLTGTFQIRKSTTDPPTKAATISVTLGD